jgi:hypothetical protein
MAKLGRAREKRKLTSGSHYQRLREEREGGAGMLAQEERVN